MPRNNSFTITNKTKGRLPRLPFAKVKKDIMGDSYVLSLVFIGASQSRFLNKKHRGKNAPANVLSFPLSGKEGEVFIAPAKAAKDAPLYGMSYRRFVLYLFIHGLFHLKGFSHGGTMDRKEAQFLKKYAP